MSERLWTLRANVTLNLPEVPRQTFDENGYYEREGKPAEEEAYSLTYTSRDRAKALTDLIALLTTVRGHVEGPEPGK